MLNKKIIISGYNLGGFGGMETVFNLFHDILTNYKKIKFEILFVFFEDKNKPLSDEWIGNKKYIRLFSKIRNTKIRRIHFSYQFSKILSDYRPDYILSHDPIGCYISSWARKFSFRTNPCIYSWHHFSINDFYRKEYLLYADKHLAISSGIAYQLANLGAKKNDIYTIYNPIEPFSNIIPRSCNNKFIYVGRILYRGQKNLQEMLHAFSLVSGDWTLDIVGSGSDDDMNKLKSLAINLNISENIKWHGWKSSPWDYVRYEIKSIDCLILTSTYEGFGMVLVEAISQGVFCISSDCLSGPSDIINDDNGKLYPPGDISALASEIQSVINQDTLPDNYTIKESIHHLSNDEWLKKLISALSM